MEEIVPVVAIVMVFIIPLIAVLTHHQRKMAELVHRNQIPTPMPDQARLEREIDSLKQLMHQQAIALDNLQGKLDLALSRGDEEEVRQRLKGA